MEKINGIILDGKIYIATEDSKDYCLGCDIVADENMNCPCMDYCRSIGYCNVFRYSPGLTERLKGGGK